MQIVDRNPAANVLQLALVTRVPMAQPRTRQIRNLCPRYERNTRAHSPRSRESGYGRTLDGVDLSALIGVGGGRYSSAHDHSRRNRATHARTSDCRRRQPRPRRGRLGCSPQRHSDQSASCESLCRRALLGAQPQRTPHVDLANLLERNLAHRSAHMLARLRTPRP